ncbi:hypothetical protein RJ639_030795 [Escallonia herrerae]|uniref:Thiamine pyrophosphate enzyme N-terminal TPP-binding domain-containing protein n=1 Tax=Escallonia herrerae TaxID=1293975 RepID=A0AA89BD26_9ASTE|nr:hypothetical protein RJ639_030795 [Escallonia herrerae]
MEEGNLMEDAILGEGVHIVENIENLNHENDEIIPVEEFAPMLINFFDGILDDVIMEVAFSENLDENSGPPVILPMPLPTNLVSGLIGATNLISGLADALHDGIPLVAITGQVPRRMISADSFQETPIVPTPLPTPSSTTSPS